MLPIPNNPPAPKPVVRQNQFQGMQTPGGVNSNAPGDPRYASQVRPGTAGHYGAASGGSMYLTPAGDGGAPSSGWRPSANPDVADFQEYEDRAYDAAARRMDPRFAQERRGIEQQLINQGIDPTSQAGRQYLDQWQQRRDSAYSDAAFGAQGAGLQAQEQMFSQGNRNDQLRLGAHNAAVAAAASRYGSQQAAGASRYGADASRYSTDAQRYLGELGHQLGFSQLNEQGRQFDVNDIFRSGQQDLQILQSLFGMGTGLNRQAGQQFNMNADYANNWWNQVGSMLQQSTGGIFTPVDVVGSANAQTSAGSARDQFTVGLMGALGGAVPG